MKHLSDYQPSIGSDNGQPKEPPNAPLMDELWRRMGAIYGHKWVSSYGESDEDHTWALGLSDMKQEEISCGLSACATRPTDGESWPPTLPEFRELCRPAKPAYHQEYQSLPAPKISKEEALAWVNKIRAELKV